jgi:predicted DNA-binding transcriptional regulator AlpA
MTTAALRLADHPDPPPRESPADCPAVEAPPVPADPIDQLAARPVVAPARVLTREQLAHELQVSVKTIDRLDQTGKLPRPIRVGQARRWRLGTIVQWLDMGAPDRERFETLTGCRPGR